MLFWTSSLCPATLHRSQEVRSYLLKPLPDKCSVEVSEIQPAELAATDLDVRLTLVGTDSADVDADYYVGEGDDTAYTDDDSPTATGAGSRRYDAIDSPV